jgi:hypothetical protein
MRVIRPNQIDLLHLQAAKVQKTKPEAGFSSWLVIPVLRI